MNEVRSRRDGGIDPHEELVETERAMAGHALLGTEEADAVLSALNGLGVYYDRHRIVLDALRDIRASGRPVDLLAAQVSIAAAGKGGVVTPYDLTVMVQHAAPGHRIAELAEYLRILREQADCEGVDEVADPAGGRPRIELRDELAEMADAAEAALAADPDAGIYVRARRLVRVGATTGRTRGGLTRARGAPVIEPLGLDALREAIDRAAEWVRRDRRGKERRVVPPEWLARTLAARGSWPFQDLEGIIEQPALRPDGTVLDRQGYDRESGLLYAPTATFAAVPERPTAQQTRDAIKALYEPTSEFPFVAASDRAAALAAVLAVVARHAILGCVPLTAIRATAPGTGKSLLADVIAIIATGRTAARAMLPREDAELRKVVTALALDGGPLVLMDNVAGALGSATLSAALTASEWDDRLLGRNVRVRAPLRTVWIATGNGLTFRGDIPRRVVVCDLDVQLEHPEDRKGWAHPDLIGWTLEQRALLVVATLTLLRGYIAAGQPAHGGPPLGGFEPWDALVRGALVWSGLGDPLGGIARVRREDDGDRAALRALLRSWDAAFGSQPLTAAGLLREADDRARLGDPALRDALEASTTGRELTGRAIGYALRHAKGRIVGGLYLRDAGLDRKGFVRWQVSPVGGSHDAEGAEDADHAEDDSRSLAGA